MKEECFELEQGSIHYVIKNQEIRITSYHGNGMEVVLPSSITKGIETLPVTIIGKKAFLGKKKLKKIVLPESIREIEDYAFANCGKLESIVICKECKICGQGILQGCKNLKYIYGDRKEEEKETAALLATTIEKLASPFLFDLKEAGSSEWILQWDNKLIQFLRENDMEGFTTVILCGEEDYGSDENSLSYFVRQKRLSKVSLCFLRLMHSKMISKNVKEELEQYIKNHSKGGESEEAWQYVWREHGSQREYYQMLMDCGGVTKENFDDILQDLGEDYSEMKSYLMKYKEEVLGYDDFFGSLEL